MLADLLNEIYGKIDSNLQATQDTNTSAILGVDLSLSESIFELKIKSPESIKILDMPPGVFSNSKAHLWFHIKSDNQYDGQEVLTFIKNQLAEYLDPQFGQGGGYCNKINTCGW